MEEKTLDSLTILSLRREDGGTNLPFTAFDLFDGIYDLFGSIRYLTLTDIDLKRSGPYPLWEADEEYPDWKNERVHFKACTAGVIDAYSTHSPGVDQELVFEHCNFYGLEYALPRTPHLTLKNLNAKSLEIAIQEGDAIKMAFEDCPELTDKVILALLKEDPEDLLLKQPNLTDLRIHGCPRVSVKALKKVVSGRQKHHLATKEMWRDIYRSDEDCHAPPLTSLILSGKNRKSVSNAMRGWFEANLEEFLEC
ncbi:hypothetical protein EST38_g13169 [Candolleomyces aberdarensis]|uniref:Uncharacterized protein n=1 Tax=Candolleomyces aberdarensis TaxID=2316362 RepID=A0A4Q2D2W7_9AGAR|nr:hypothetical protein EST38_g13169 [Candolleomyces aberdarensis]